VSVRVMAATDRGLKRSHNEDSFATSWLDAESHDGETGSAALLVVADGMGGAQGGEIASRMAVETVVEQFRAHPAGDELAALREAVETANERIHRKSVETEGLDGMGTTCTAAIIRENAIWLAHVGDSRAYLVRDGEARQLTRDHSLVSELVARGELDAESAKSDRRRNVVLRSVGVAPHVDVDSRRADMEPEPGDSLVLCTDGLHGQVEDREIAEIAGLDSLREACHRLVALARQRGGPDNITVVIAKVDGGSAPSVARPSTATAGREDVPLPTRSIEATRPRKPARTNLARPSWVWVWVAAAVLVLLVIGLIRVLSFIGSGPTTTSP